MSCFGGEDEHLYLAELTVDKLKLTSDTIQAVGDQPVLIGIKFIDFPLIQISQHDFYFVPRPAAKRTNTLEFHSGQSFLFSEKPRDLVKAIQHNPLKIYVFRRGDTYPTAETEVFLSGCFCNQIIMAENDDESAPKPFVMKGCFNLLDPGENQAGNIFFDFRLTCFGKYIVNQFHVQPKTIFFKNKNMKSEFFIERLGEVDYLTAKCLAKEKPEIFNSDSDREGKEDFYENYMKDRKSKSGLTI